MKTVKQCSGCQRELPLDAFHVDKGHSDGRVSRCKSCRAKWVESRTAERVSYNAQYYARNRDKRIAEIHEYQRRHPEIQVRYRHRYRARKHKAPGGHTYADLVAIFEKQDSKCFYCNQHLASIHNGHFDHVIPLSRGGSDNPENLVFACPPCNWSKHARMPDEIGDR
jgi:5-methylcytosine-specific restriction endonuclease McrA